MNLHHWLQLFIEEMNETTPWQWVAVLLGVAEVLLAKVNNIWLYPIGIIGTLIGIYYLLDVHLYADSILNGYYVVMSFYGWYYWIKKRHEPPVKITWATPREWVITVLIIVVSFAIFYTLIGTQLLHFLLGKYAPPPSNVPVWDSWVSATAWAGMWLLARRKMENWILLNLSNLFAIPLLFYKKLPLFGIEVFVLFVVAFFGFFQWLRIWRNENDPTQPSPKGRASGAGEVSPGGGDLEGVVS